MPATRYKIWQVGNPVGRGVTGSFHVGVAGIAKTAKDGPPPIVANELICSHLARAILLPIPPGFLIENEGTTCYVSLNFNLAGEDLPPADPAAIVAQHPRLACGIVLFDIWLLNGDRHRKNLAHDQATGRVQVFDHSHAFFIGTDGKAHLDKHRDHLGIRKHCLAGELRSFDGMREWSERIESIPEFYIRDVLAAAVEVGLPKTDKEYCTDYLLRRRDRLLKLVRDNRDCFSKVEPTLWNDLDDNGGRE